MGSVKEGQSEERISEEPGGAVQYGAERWDVVARVEDDRSDFAPEERLSRRDLEDMVETFQSDRRRVPWITGYLSDGAKFSGFPGHFSLGPPVGEIVELATDRINLWAKTLPIVDPDTGKDRMRHVISQGFTERSIGYRLRSAETEGKPVLRHVALLSMSEPPGIPNMPRLDRSSAPDLERFGGLETITGRVDGERLRCRSAVISTSARTAEKELSMPLSQETLDAITAATSAAVTTAIEPIRSSLDALEQRASEPESSPEPVSEPEPVKPEPDRAALAQRVRDASDAAIRQGRPADRVLQFEGSLDRATLTEEQVAVFERGLKAIPAVIDNRIAHEVRGSDGESVIVNPDRFRILGAGAQSQVNFESLDVLMECAPKARRPDGSIDHDALRAAIYAASGEPLPSASAFELS